MTEFGTKPLFIFELANNHSGSVDLGLRIIREVHAVAQKYRTHFDLGFKFQYRHLDTFIHPAYKDRQDIKYVKRFLETRLDAGQFKRLKDEVSSLGCLAICTPFDEASVDLIEAHGYDIVKVASCSLTDWPLLERIARTSTPIIGSTAGVPLENVDQVVSFFKHRHKRFALLHCVAEYPTGNAHLELNQIDLLRNRYQDVPVGFSTHEAPGDVRTVMMAAAKGAMIFERHVGVATDKVKLNDYSATPAQVGKWLEAAVEAFEMCGLMGQRCRFGDKELSSLAALRRGAFAKRTIRKGERIQPSDLFLAIPTVEGQVTANDLSKYTIFTAVLDIPENEPVLFKTLDCVEIRGKVEEILGRVKTLLRQSQVVVPQQADIDISHHYGIDRFYDKGCTILNFLNREYCKKLIAILPGQSHPEQYHLKKEETFIVLYGDVEIILDGVAQSCKRGDIITVERGVKHIFSSKGGAVIEEISSTHFKDDSYYTDPAIGANPNRKTQLTYWLD